MSRLVIAVGGNALEPRAHRSEDDPSAESGSQAEVLDANLRVVADAVAELAEHDLVLTHGNGPQVGRLALQAEAAGTEASLDVLGAEAEGMLGYAIERAIRSRLQDRPVVALLTQVQVDPEDPAFADPSKPIGPTYSRENAERLAGENGWTVAPDGPGWRRVVASPRPRRILGLDAVRLLLDAGHVVVCAGGGGIPVVVGADGEVRGVEAVVDKDRSSALLAEGLRADRLLLLTDVPALFEDWPERERPLRHTTPKALRELDLAKGSMGPKAEAAADFVEATGGTAVIGALADAAAMLAGEAGTRVEP